MLLYKYIEPEITIFSMKVITDTQLLATVVIRSPTKSHVFAYNLLINSWCCYFHNERRYYHPFQAY